MSDPTIRTDAPAPLEQGTKIAERYELIGPLASGGMATVWRATDTVLARPVAVKILHQHLANDPEFVARFRREAVAAARLAHPGIVAMYDTCADPESIIMELVEGRTLRAELDASGRLRPAEAVAIASAVCEALDAAHKAGIVHRDIKPANILLSTDGRVKVADFGIAKAARDGDDDGNDPDIPDLTTVGRMVGTAKYLAPEQVRGGEVDARTDVYALGTVLYEMVCGRPPFSGDNDLAMATARLGEEPPRPRSILRTLPEALDRIIMRALRMDPADRYDSATAMWADLQQCPTEDSAPPPPPDATLIEDAPSFATAERSWLVPTLLVSMIALALGVAWLLIGGKTVREDFLDLVDRVTPGVITDDGAEPISFTATAYDPEGTGGEHDDEAVFVTDDDPETVWRTERYTTREFGLLKSGVGLILDTGGDQTIDRIDISAADPGWSADIYVANQLPASFSGWGEPEASITDAGAHSGVDLDARGSVVLVWFTDLGEDPGVILSIAGIELRGG